MKREGPKVLPLQKKSYFRYHLQCNLSAVTQIARVEFGFRSSGMEALKTLRDVLHLTVICPGCALGEGIVCQLISINSA